MPLNLELLNDGYHIVRIYEKRPYLFSIWGVLQITFYDQYEILPDSIKINPALRPNKWTVSEPVIIPLDHIEKIAYSKEVIE